MTELSNRVGTQTGKTDAGGRVQLPPAASIIGERLVKNTAEKVGRTLPGQQRGALGPHAVGSMPPS